MQVLAARSGMSAPGYGVQSALAGLQPYRAGSYRGTLQSPGLPRKLCMPSGTGGGVRRLLVFHEEAPES